MLDILKPYAQILSGALINFSENGPKNHIEYVLDCSILRNYTKEDINDSLVYSELKEKFVDLKGPCVYWFEIISDNNVEILWNALLKYKLEKMRIVPAMKKNMPIGSKILYLGKVKKGLLGRLKQHLGYGNASTTQSVQLCHWAVELGLSLRIHVLEFEEEMSNLVSVFEFKLARKIKPIIGKHST